MSDDTEQRVAAALGALCRWMWHCSPRMIPRLVTRRGTLGSLMWFAGNMPRYMLTLHVLGPVRTHLACMALSMRNGCPYCAYGHAHALELIYFRDRRRLFPVDATTLAGWQGLPPRELTALLHQLLEQAGLHCETLWVDRVLDLAAGTQLPIDRAELRLAHLVRMVAVMNDAARGCPIAPGEAMDLVNRDIEVKTRWAAAMAAV